ncbi:hypothetical protein GY45DRAFT_1372006 [Cubamyces sp. BRFM 1775]|nr:hypothetical protein GY45DRAFT_1372006 [Cubamyces sp. BRFM 1775]
MTTTHFIPSLVDPLIDELCAGFDKLVPENTFTRTDPAKVIPSFLRHSVRRAPLERLDVPVSSPDALLPGIVRAGGKLGGGEVAVDVQSLSVAHVDEREEDGQPCAADTYSDDTLIMSPRLIPLKEDLFDECKAAEDHITTLAPQCELLTSEPTTDSPSAISLTSELQSSCSVASIAAAADIHTWRSRHSASSLDQEADSTLHELGDDSDSDGCVLSALPERLAAQRCSLEYPVPTAISCPSSPVSDEHLEHTGSAGALATVDDSDEASSGPLLRATSEAELDTRDSPVHQDSVDSVDLPLDDSDWFRTSSPRSPRPLSVLPGLSLVSLDGLPFESDDSANCLGLDFGGPDVSPVPSRPRTRCQSPAWLVDDSVSLELETVCSTARRLLFTEDYCSSPQLGLPSALSCSSSMPGSVSGLDENEDEEDYAVEGEDEDAWAQVRKGLGCVALAGSVAFLYLAVLTY